jgi:hypothetical protein
VGKGYTKTQVLKAISNSGGVMTVVQQRLGCNSWETARKYVDKWAETRERWETEKKHTDDMAQSVIIKDIQSGNVQTSKWWLERRRRREYALDQRALVGAQENESDEDTELRIIIDDDKQ